jgi:hypothetical protein
VGEAHERDAVALLEVELDQLLIVAVPHPRQRGGSISV